jgi:hypothetical protein
MIAKENLMRSIVSVAGLATILCLAVPAGFCKTPATPSKSGSIVIVFKDGHRQSFNLSDIQHIEFPATGVAATTAAPTGSPLPSRSHFVGKWEVGDGNGRRFFIALEDNGDAKKSIGATHGKWVYVDGEARITWDDGWQDAIRKAGSKYQKFAYSSGKSFADTPDNVTGARPTIPRPI